MEDQENNLNEEAYFKLKVERRQRLRVAMAVVPAILGLTALLLSSTLTSSKYSLLLPYYINSTILSLGGTFLLSLSGISILMVYLQTGFKKNGLKNVDYYRYENEIKDLKNIVEHESNVNYSTIEYVNKQIDELKDKYEENMSITSVIDSHDKSEIINIIKKDITEESYKEATKEILEKIEDSVNKKNQFEDIESIFSRTHERLYSEISSLSRRGNLNLSLGIFTTIIGLSILGYFVIEVETTTKNTIEYITQFIPRLSLVILIEVFAYFFLKLYKSSLSEIKYFQNEMTNSEAKLAAIKCSMNISDNETTSFVVKALSETERNSILEKGQTTAEIEKSRIEYQNVLTLSDRVSKIIGTDRKYKK